MLEHVRHVQCVQCYFKVPVKSSATHFPTVQSYHLVFTVLSLDTTLSRNTMRTYLYDITNKI